MLLDMLQLKTLSYAIVTGMSEIHCFVSLVVSRVFWMSEWTTYTIASMCLA